MVVRSVSCRSSSRPCRPVERSRARSSRSRTARNGITATCRAASSIPSGSPSSRRSTSTRSGASSAVSSKSVRRRRACSMKARTLDCRRRDGRSVASLGTGSGCSRTTYSPGTCSVTRDVASTRTPGAPRLSAITSSRHAAIDVLAVVQDEEQLTVGQRRRRSGRARPPPEIRRPKLRHDRLADAVGAVDDGERDDHRLAELGQVRRDVERQSGLADATGAGERDDGVSPRAAAPPPLGRAADPPSGRPAWPPGVRPRHAGRTRRRPAAPARPAPAVGIEPGLVDQPSSEGLGGAHRLRRATVRRQRAHVQQRRRLTQRRRGRGRGGVHGHVAVPARQPCLEHVVDQLQAQLVQPDRGDLQRGQGPELRPAPDRATAPAPTSGSEAASRRAASASSSKGSRRRR